MECTSLGRALLGLSLFALAAPALAEDVVWTNAVGVSVSGNSLTKTGGTGWNSGAASVNVIRDGYGYAEFSVPAGTHILVGLGLGDTDQNYPDVEFGWHAAPGGALTVYESGSSRGSFGSYAAGDRLRVEVRHGVARYFHNGVLKYTTLQPLPGLAPLRVDATLYDTGASVEDVEVGGLVWENECSARQLMRI